MKSSASVSFLILVSMLLPGLAIANQQEVRAIEDRLNQYETRFNQGDAEAVAALFSEDVVYYDALGQVHEGREAVQKLYQGNFDAGFRDMTVEPIEIEVLEDTAYDIARYTVSGPEGTRLQGHHLAILSKEDGEWTVQRTMVNAAMPQPPAN